MQIFVSTANLVGRKKANKMTLFYKKFERYCTGIVNLIALVIVHVML